MPNRENNMKLRLVSCEKNLLLYCEDGTTLEADEALLRTLFISFQSTSIFKGGKEKWNSTTDRIEKAPGRTLAYINESNELCITDANPFYALISSVGKEEYITLKEYADLHKKGVARIKLLCANNQLAGAVFKGGVGLSPSTHLIPRIEEKKTNDIQKDASIF